MVVRTYIEGNPAEVSINIELTEGPTRKVKLSQRKISVVHVEVHNIYFVPWIIGTKQEKVV